MASEVPRERVVSAVNALLKWKEAQSATHKPQLLPEDDCIYLNLTLKKIPPKPRTNPFKIPLSKPLFDPNSEVCLIIDDRPKSNLTSEDAKKIVKSQNLPVSKVVRLSKLKSNYKPFEAKRKLCDSYDLFLVDRRVVHLLPKLLGKFFFKKKKLPLPLDLSHKNWKEQIERAMGCGLLYMRTGTCCVMKVGKVSMENEEIVENVVQWINGIVKVVPKKWGGVRSLHLKFSDSLALPVYQALPDVKLKIDGVKETKDVSDDEGQVVELREESSGGEGVMGKKKKKKKGRIHEVRYMDVVVDGDELGSEEDEDDDNEGKMKMFAEENVGSDDEREGDEGKKSEDEEDEDFDSDDSGIKKPKKVKSVKGLQKKTGRLAKGAKGSSEKKEKKKSNLGARLKEGSITKKAKRSNNRV